MAGIVQAKEAFTSDATGGSLTVAAGATLSASHPLAKAHPGLVEPFVPDFPWPLPDRGSDRIVEQATAKPGKRRGEQG